MCLGAKRRYINTLPFLSFPFLSFPLEQRCFTKHKPHAGRSCALPSPPPAATEWSRLLLNYVICSEHVTVHFQWEGSLSLVTLTLTFDLDIQTRPSEGPNTSSL